MNIKIKTLAGELKTIESDVFANFGNNFRGKLIDKDHPEYHHQRQIWNAMIDRQPALIAQCSGNADIINAMKFAIEHDLLFSVRGGGHNIAGSAVCDDALMIDLSQLRAVQVDPIKHRAIAQAGALLGDLDHETQQFGLAVPTGINSTTGIAGLTLGGGYGWLSRLYGHSVDNLISVKMIGADGQWLTASDNENQDLFWAIRGGSGNFGIISQFEFKLHQVGPNILSGPVIYAAADAPMVLRKYREFAKQMPDQACCWSVLRKAPPFPFLAEEHHGKPVLILAMAYFGDLKQGEQSLSPLRQLASPLADAVAPHRYVDWQSAFDPLLIPGARNYWKSNDFLELADGLIDDLVDASLQLPDDECEIFIAMLGGAASRVPADAMAFPHRSTQFTMNIHGRWQDQDKDKSCISWVRESFKKTEPFATGGVYVNFVPEFDEVRKLGAYGSNQKRLSQLKHKYDPMNRFRNTIRIDTDKA